MQTLRKINKPIVWTMRDMWPLTGGCHYAMDCEQYRTGCGKCPQLGSQFIHDLSRLVVSNKRRSLKKRMRLIGISEWLSSCARDSFVFSGFKIDTIANNIDTDQFFPVNRVNAREILGLPSNKKIVLVGATSITDFYKGYDLFVESIKSLDMSDIHVVIFGNTNTQALEKLGAQHTILGYLADTISLRLAYSASDVFVAPSRMEAFGKTLVEAMACGTPVVCFDAICGWPCVLINAGVNAWINCGSLSCACCLPWPSLLTGSEHDTPCFGHRWAGFGGQGIGNPLVVRWTGGAR
jgi:glycosyltransferase involved in cell wall biosynthesis